jgi:hypothetical protein
MLAGMASMIAMPECSFRDGSKWTQILVQELALGLGLHEPEQIRVDVEEHDRRPTPGNLQPNVDLEVLQGAESIHTVGDNRICW